MQSRLVAYLAAAALGALALAASSQDSKPAPIRMGEGLHTYEWVRGWGDYRADGPIGNTHGCVVIDFAGRIYFNTDSERAVIVLSPEGKILKSWGKEWAGGLHGMTLVREGDQEFLYLAHTARHQVAKTTLDGEVLWTIDAPMDSGAYEKPEQFVPTSVAVAENGDVYVGDGYGKSWIHRFDRDRKRIHSWGGWGTEPGKMKSPHGIAIVERRGRSWLYVCDRENSRLQVFDLEGRHVGFVEPGLRRPSNLHQRGESLAVADLEGRVTILDGNDKIVCHLGDNPDPAKRANNGVPMDQWVDGAFTSPHNARFDAEGNLFVLDWVSSGRLSKLLRVKGR